MFQITYNVDQHNSYQDLTNNVLTMKFRSKLQEEQNTCISITIIANPS